MFRDIDKFYIYIILIMLFIGFIIPALLYYSINNYIVNPIDKLINIANKIGKGEDIQIKIEKPQEFAQLASTFDKMTKDIKSITLEKAKMNSPLTRIAMAKMLSQFAINVLGKKPNNSAVPNFTDVSKKLDGDHG